MYKPTIITWIIISFGVLTCLPLLGAQLIMIFKPNSKQARDIMIGKGEDWRDKTHFKSAFSLAIVDWLIFAPVFLAALIGVIQGTFWGYIFLIISGAIQLYVNVFLWFFEKEYVYKANGAFAYFTYLWGNFIYWSLAASIYGCFRLYSGTI